MSADNGRLGCLRLLLDAGSCVDRRTAYHDYATPLAIAIENSRVRCVVELLHAGASLALCRSSVIAVFRAAADALDQLQADTNTYVPRFMILRAETLTRTTHELVPFVRAHERDALVDIAIGLCSLDLPVLLVLIIAKRASFCLPLLYPSSTVAWTIARHVKQFVIE